MLDPLSALRDAGHQVCFWSYSALDQYFRLNSPGDLFLLTDSSLIGLAKLFDGLGYPPWPYEDASCEAGGLHYRFRCYDDLEPLQPAPYSVQELRYDPGSDRFFDPRGIYSDLRKRELFGQRGGENGLFRLGEAARMVSRYHYQVQGEELSVVAGGPDLGPELQRDLLCGILQGRHPEKGLNLLHRSGFIEAFWPELARMGTISHLKDYHPEGDAWVHTLETFQHRKQGDLILSLALLLHDVGKPQASGTLEKPFDGHAELGAEIAGRFLKRLAFPVEMVDSVVFLVRYHMMPAAIRRLPLFRIERILASPLFPSLLELYRADLSASFWGPGPYYEACRFYQGFLRNRSNPFRRSDGQKPAASRRNHFH